MDLTYGVCVAAMLFPLKCDAPIMKFREVYVMTCSASKYPAVTGEETQLVFRRIADGTALYQDYVRTWHEACDKKEKK